MIKNKLKIIFVLFVSVTGYGQFEYFDWDNVRYGGRINLDISNRTTSIIVSPTAVYKLSPQFSLGGSVSVGYTKFQYPEEQLFNYGFSILSYYYPVPKIQLMMELEETFVKGDGLSTLTGEKFTYNYKYPSLYIGAAYRVRNFGFGLRYDVLYKEGEGLFASPFSPFIQVFL